MLMASLGSALSIAALESAEAQECGIVGLPNNVAYSCPENAPYLDFVGVCTPENTGYRCSPGCTVCFCSNSFHSRSPCASVADSGPNPYHKEPGGCTIAHQRPQSAWRIVALGALFAASAWFRRRRKR